MADHGMVVLTNRKPRSTITSCDTRSDTFSRKRRFNLRYYFAKWLVTSRSQRDLATYVGLSKFARLFYEDSREQ